MRSASPSWSWSPPLSAFAGFRFPPEVIVLAVRWYLRFHLSFRDVEELLAERGVEVDHVTVYRWVQRFTRLLADAARFARHSPGDRWFVDETYVKGRCCIRGLEAVVSRVGSPAQIAWASSVNAAATRIVDGVCVASS